MTFLIQGIKIGTVTDEKNTISNSVFVKAVPLSSSSSTIVTNLFGKKRTISIQGVNVGTDYGTGSSTQAEKIDLFIEDVEDWVNTGDRQSRRLITDSFGNTYSCICTDFTWTRNQSTPNFLLFSMILVEGGFS